MDKLFRSDRLLRNARQFPRQTIFVEARIEPLRDFLKLQFHCHPMQKQKVLVAQLVHLRVQKRTQLVRIDGKNGKSAHAYKRPHPLFAGKTKVADPRES